MSALITSVCYGSHLIVRSTVYSTCTLLTVSIAVENIMAILNSTTPQTDFSPQDYQRLIEKYLYLSQENDRFVKTVRAGTQVDINYIRYVLQTDFPLHARLHDYFSRLRAGCSNSVDQFSFDPRLGGNEGASRSVDVNMEGNSEMKLASECDPDAMSIFSSTTASVFAEGPHAAVSDQGPFGIRFSDFPPRVISQMLSTHMGGSTSGCGCFHCFLGAYTHPSPAASWRGMFKWAGFEHASRNKKFMIVPMIGLSVTNGKDLYEKQSTTTSPAHPP